MQKLRSIFSGSSPIAITAMLSVLLLVGVTTSKFVLALNPPAASPAKAALASALESASSAPASLQAMLLWGEATSTDIDAATSSDDLSLIGPLVQAQLLGTYSAIRDNGKYSQDDLRTAAQKIAAYMKAAVSYPAFKNADFTTTSDTSAPRVRQYRDALVDTLKPLSSIPTAEYVIYGHYVETNDPTYLKQLSDAAAKYRECADAAAKIEVPQDAVAYHRDVLNSLRAFASVLDGLATHADDPFASVALMRTYNEKEQGIYDSYDRMRNYFGAKSI